MPKYLFASLRGPDFEAEGTDLDDAFRKLQADLQQKGKEYLLYDPYRNMVALCEGYSPHRIQGGAQKSLVTNIRAVKPEQEMIKIENFAVPMYKELPEPSCTGYTRSSSGEIIQCQLKKHHFGPCQ